MTLLQSKTRAILSVSLALCALPHTARAHGGGRKYVELTESRDHIEARISLDGALVSATFGLGAELDENALDAQRTLVSSWLSESLRIQRDGSLCAAGDAEVTLSDSNQKLTAQIQYDCPASGGALTVIDRGDPTHETHVQLIRGEVVQTRLFNGENREATFGASNSIAGTFSSYGASGVIHLITGWDHLLFLLSLLLGAALGSERRRFIEVLRRVSVLVTAFTVGHSITLVLGAQQVIALPQDPVEIVIAISIIAVAALNVLRPEHHSLRASLALAFGLVHGLGFSGVLSESGLPAAHRALALFSFNVGIEIGQIAVAALLLFPLVHLGRRSSYRRLWMPAGSVAIGVAGAFWVLERTLGWIT